MSCINCGVEVRKGANWCSSAICNRVRCKKYWQDNLVKERQRKLAYYYWLKATDPKKVRAINKKAVSRKRFGVSSREEILARDGYKCRNCGCSDKKLAIHHKDNRGRTTKTPNNNPDNLVTVCVSCHTKHHFGHSEMKI